MCVSSLCCCAGTLHICLSTLFFFFLFFSTHCRLFSFVFYYRHKGQAMTKGQIQPLERHRWGDVPIHGPEKAQQRENSLGERAKDRRKNNFNSITCDQYSKNSTATRAPVVHTHTWGAHSKEQSHAIDGGCPPQHFSLRTILPLVPSTIHSPGPV